MKVTIKLHHGKCRILGVQLLFETKSRDISASAAMILTIMFFMCFS